MYLKVSSNHKTGRVYLSAVHGVHDKVKKTSRTVTIQSFGYLDELQKQFPDPIAHFRAVVEEMKRQKAQADAPISLSFDPSERLAPDAGQRKNIGYAPLSGLYHGLGLHTFINNRSRAWKAQYDANAILRMLVFSRLLAPASKKKTYEGRGVYFEKMDFTLEDVYRFLSRLSPLKHDLTLHLHKRARELFGRGDDLVYYDVTNYYFEIDEQDELRRKGVSKEHRPDPIIQMGLLTDSSGIPITYDLFPGNCNDCETLAPLFREAKRDFGLGRVIVVADKGMNTGPNIVFNTLSGDGYVYAQSVRGGSAELKEYALSQRGYSETEGGFRLKSRQYKRKIVLKLEDAPWLADFGETADIAKNGRPLKTKTVYIDEKQVVIYSPDYDRRAKAERAAAVAKARDLVENPAKYKRATSYGAAKYVSNLVFDEETGAVLTTQRRLLFDEEKLREEELYDGYYAICTSEWRKKDGEILDIYQGLWRIEEAFRVSKSDLEARPVYLSREDRVKAHFLVCFIALVLARLLTRFLGGRFSVGRVVESLAKASGTEIGRNYYVFDHADEVTRAVCEMMGIDLERRFMRLGEIRALIGDTKKA